MFTKAMDTYIHFLLKMFGLTAFIDIVIPIKWPYFSELNDILKKYVMGASDISSIIAPKLINLHRYVLA